MSKIHETSENAEFNLKSIDINNLNSFLTKSGFIKKCAFSTNQTYILNYNTRYYQNLCSILEFDENFTLKDLSDNKKIFLVSIKKLFNLNFTIEEIYNQYIYFTKETISLNIFINWLIIFDLIVGNFYNLFNYEKKKVFVNMLKNKIEIFDINTIVSDNPNSDKFINKLDYLYKNLDKQKIFMGKSVLSDLIISIYILTLGNQIKINKEIPNLHIILNYFELYNKIYIFIFLY